MARPGRIAILIPCLNEAPTIAHVVSQFRIALPAADVFVFDNGSDDDTVAEAERAGARVAHEPKRGKGHVVRSMLRRVDSDIYVLVDGDGTYPAGMAADLVGPIERGEADMVVGSRLHPQATSQFRSMNRMGNQLFVLILRGLFGAPLTDFLSGYRAFTRQAAAAIQLDCGGFEVEAELTIRMLCAGYRITEVPVNLRPRARGTASKLRVVRDGLAILWTMVRLFRRYRPWAFLCVAAVAMLAVAVLGYALVLSAP